MEEQSDQIRRQNNRRLTPQDKLRAVISSKPSAYQYTPRGIIMGGRSGVMVPRESPASQMLRQDPIRSKPKPVLPAIILDASTVLITGGIGDFLAIDSFLTTSIRNMITQVFLATRAQKSITELLRANSHYHHVKSTVIYDDWSRIFCFLSKEDVFRTTKSSLDGCMDLSITKIFPHIIAGNLPYQGSAFTEIPNANIFSFELPNWYVSICPYSINDRRQGRRDFSREDWDRTINYLSRTDQVGVVLNVGNDFIPENKNLINLSNKTTIAEAIEIVKWSRGYVGIDSCLSVVAAKVLQYPSLMIKTNNSHLMEHKAVYYAPQYDFPFLTNNLTSLSTI